MKEDFSLHVLNVPSKKVSPKCDMYLFINASSLLTLRQQLTILFELKSKGGGGSKFIALDGMLGGRSKNGEGKLQFCEHNLS